ncbi:hypothetical protein VCHC17A1_2417 [Vibrio cholerae HC-17A1]|nr:hypothetical protein VCHC17A1_2417 [Vibrio cholerae HC-17A1]
MLRTPATCATSLIRAACALEASSNINKIVNFLMADVPYSLKQQ